MKFRVLGSAAGGGIPQWNCGCANCSAAREGRLRARRVACAAVSAGNGWLLINAGCDISAQFAATAQLWPKSKRTPPLAALLLTDANLDHTAGMLEFRQAETLAIYSTELVKRTLCASPVFAQFDARFHWHAFDVERHPVRLTIAEAGETAVVAIPVEGLLPAYAGGERRSGASIAYRFEQEGVAVVYAPIFLELDDRLVSGLEQADAVFLDGTCWTDDEMIALGVGKRTARQMGHAPMSGPGGSLERARGLNAKHRYFTHVNNTNPILDPASAASRELGLAGFAIPDDGLEITLDGSYETHTHKRVH